MSNHDEIITALTPVMRTLIPARERRQYEGQMPLSLWGSLFPTELNSKRIETRVKLWLKFLVRADQLNFPQARNVLDRLLPAPHTNFYEPHKEDWFWTPNFFEVPLGRLARRTQGDRTRLEAKMRDIELVSYLVGQVTGTSDITPYYEMLINDIEDHWAHARVAIAARTYLDLWDWWQQEGLYVRKQYPTLQAYIQQVRPIRFMIIGADGLALR